MDHVQLCPWLATWSGLGHMRGVFDGLHNSSLLVKVWVTCIQQYVGFGCCRTHWRVGVGLGRGCGGTVGEECARHCALAGGSGCTGLYLCRSTILHGALAVPWRLPQAARGTNSHTFAFVARTSRRYSCQVWVPRKKRLPYLRRWVFPAGLRLHTF